MKSPPQTDGRDHKKKCLDSACRLISRRDHSRMELTRKLKARGFSEEQISCAVAQCLRYDYLNDDRFAHSHARRLQRRGYGILHIRQSLRSKGLTPELVDSALEHCTDQAQLEQCRRVLNKKVKPMKVDQPALELKTRLYRYLSGRGFAPHIVAQALDSIF